MDYKRIHKEVKNISDMLEHIQQITYCCNAQLALQQQKLDEIKYEMWFQEYEILSLFDRTEEEQQREQEGQQEEQQGEQREQEGQQEEQQGEQREQQGQQGEQQGEQREQELRRSKRMKKNITIYKDYIFY